MIWMPPERRLLLPKLLAWHPGYPCCCTGGGETPVISENECVYCDTDTTPVTMHVTLGTIYGAGCRYCTQFSGQSYICTQGDPPYNTCNWTYDFTPSEGNCYSTGVWFSLWTGPGGLRAGIGITFPGDHHVLWADDLEVETVDCLFSGELILPHYSNATGYCGGSGTASAYAI